MLDTTKGWFSLDNAANLYPAIHSERLPMVFRISAILKQRVHAGLLQQALDAVLPRFPYYQVRLRAGFFWYYLEENPARPLVRAEGASPCETLPDEDGNGYLFRVQAYKSRVSVEFSHIITDGTGGLIFFKTLLATYLERRGFPVGDWGELFNPADDPDPEEFEDAYSRYHTKPVPNPGRLNNAFTLPYPLRQRYRYTYLTGECSSSAVYALAKQHDVSVTEYLAGVYLFILQGIYHDMPRSAIRRAKPTLRMQIPVNLRRLYPTKSMRNFTLFVTPGIDMRLGWYDLDEIIKRVHLYMAAETDIRNMSQQLARNVKLGRKILIRSIPLVLKNSIIVNRYNTRGPNQYSGVLTNLGVVKMPETIADQIESFTFVPPPGRELRIHGAVATYGDKMHITFGNVTDVRELQRRFFRFLADSGIHVKLYRYKDV
jgi:hypothetical protein